MTWLLLIPSLALIVLAAAQYWHRRNATDAKLFPEPRDGGDDA